LWEPTLAVSDDGSALVVWATQTSSEGRQLWARSWQSTSGWAPAERIDGLQAEKLEAEYTAAVALDPGGNGLVVWASQGIVAARFVAGRGWTDPERIGTAPAFFEYRAVSIDPFGRALVTWVDFPRGWGPTQAVVSAVGAEAEDLGVNPGGDGFIVWRQRFRSLGEEQVLASRYVNGKWEAAQPLEATSNGTGRAAIAVDPCGNAIAVWAEYEPGRIRVWANRFETGPARYAGVNPAPLAAFARCSCAPFSASLCFEEPF